MGLLRLLTVMANHWCVLEKVICSQNRRAARFYRSPHSSQTSHAFTHPSHRAGSARVYRQHSTRQSHTLRLAPHRESINENPDLSVSFLFFWVSLSALGSCVVMQPALLCFRSLRLEAQVWFTESANTWPAAWLQILRHPDLSHPFIAKSLAPCLWLPVPSGQGHNLWPDSLVVLETFAIGLFLKRH